MVDRQTQEKIKKGGQGWVRELFRRWRDASRTSDRRGLPAPGIYSYSRQEENGKVHVHLRVESDGGGLLLVNAARIFHLNPTAAFIAYLVLEGADEKSGTQALQRAYSIPQARAGEDFRQTAAQVIELVRPDGACPVCDLELETLPPFSQMPSAPYRMDLALTYRCSNDCAHCYNQRGRARQEWDTAHWKEAIRRLWDAGIPHVVFTGGEPTLRPDLPELVKFAQGMGQITGLNTNGRKLEDAGYVQSLVDAGLDHVQITLESHDPAVHDGMVLANGAWEETVAGVRNVLQTSLYVMTNTTLLRSNTPGLEHTLDFLAELGVPTVGLNALIYSGRGKTVGSGLPEADLPPLLETARRLTGAHGQRLIWYTPTRYCRFDPVQMQLGVKGCTAALYNMCVEPDGSVLPCQSYYQPLGNLLEDGWQSIWNHDLAVSLRQRRDVPLECLECAFLAECGGGCPLARGH